MKNKSSIILASDSILNQSYLKILNKTGEHKGSIDTSTTKKLAFTSQIQESYNKEMNTNRMKK